MTSLAAPVRREWPTLVACAIGAAPAILFSAAWALTSYAGLGTIAMFLMIAVALCVPGWAAWVAFQAGSSLAVVGAAVAATMSGPAIQLVFVGGSRLERALLYGWIGFAFLVGILVAVSIVRRGGSTWLAVGSVLGANALCLAMLPLFWLLQIRF